MLTTFIGIDASWKAGKPSGVAVARGSRFEATLSALIYAQKHDDVAAIVQEYRSETTIVAIDAPLVVTNPAGTCRNCERSIGQVFGRFGASAHTMNLPKFERYGLGRLVGLLENLGFEHGIDGAGVRTDGLRMFEVYPHPAHIRLFGRQRIVRYKSKYGVAQQRVGLCELRDLTAQLSTCDGPSLEPGADGRAFLSCDLSTLRGKSIKRYEDLLDAWLCAYLAMHLACSGMDGNEVFGTREDGYIVVPACRDSTQ